jgi:hypothetical protein
MIYIWNAGKVPFVWYMCCSQKHTSTYLSLLVSPHHYFLQVHPIMRTRLPRCLRCFNKCMRILRSTLRHMLSIRKLASLDNVQGVYDSVDSRRLSKNTLWCTTICEDSSTLLGVDRQLCARLSGKRKFR